MAKFFVADLIFTKQYFKLKEIVIATVLSVPFFLLVTIMPGQKAYTGEQMRNVANFANIFQFTLVLPLITLNSLGAKKGF